MQDTKADAKMRESILSRIPPCPGSKLEKSLTPKVLLIEEKTKSPTSEINGIIIEIIMMWKKCVVSKTGNKGLSFNAQINAKTTETIIEKTTPPMNPSQVFFGEILSFILCFPNNIPMKYAPMSLKMTPKIT